MTFLLAYINVHYLILLSIHFEIGLLITLILV